MNCITAKNITKSYQSFSLHPTSISLPVGGKLVILGEEGSGKSTLLRCLLGLSHADSGEVSFFQGDSLSYFLEKTGVVLGNGSLPFHLYPKQVERIFSPQYQRWNKKLYANMLEILELSMDKPLENKLRARECLFACAMAHDPDLLVIDRPCYRELYGEKHLEETSDRQQSLEEQAWRESEQKCLSLIPGCFSGDTQLHTRHNVEDLPPAVTHLAFFKEGKLLLFGERLKMLEHCATITCTPEELALISPEDYLRGMESEEGYSLLVQDRFEFFLKYPKFKTEDITIAQVCQMLQEGEVFSQGTSPEENVSPVSSTLVDSGEKK